MRLCGIRTDIQSALAVLHIVVRIGHRTVAPGVGHAGHRGGVADARLVVAIVRAPEAHELAQQVSLLVAVLGRSDEVDAVRPAGLAQLHHLRGDLVERDIPADALVLAVHPVSYTHLTLPTSDLV